MINIIVCLILFLKLNCVFPADTVCTGKYYIPPDEKDMIILKRNVSVLEHEKAVMRPTGGRLTNTGETIYMDFYFRPEDVPILSEGPLGEESYKFSNMYFHWLEAEQTAKTGIFMELHIVFINTRYDHYYEASQKNGGLVVMSFRHVNNGETYSNDYYEYLTDVVEPGDNLLLDASETPGIFEVAFFIDSYNFYVGKSTYFYENLCHGGDVIWIETGNVFGVTPEEVKTFRNLKSFHGIPLMNKTRAFTPPHSPIYKGVDLFAYDQSGSSVAPFEGLGITMEETSEASFKVGGKLNTLVMMIVFIIVNFL